GAQTGGIRESGMRASTTEPPARARPSPAIAPDERRNHPPARRAHGGTATSLRTPTVARAETPSCAKRESTDERRGGVPLLSFRKRSNRRSRACSACSRARRIEPPHPCRADADGGRPTIAPCYRGTLPSPKAEREATERACRA